jgi:hypothetical protein
MASSSSNTLGPFVPLKLHTGLFSMMYLSPWYPLPSSNLMILLIEKAPVKIFFSVAFLYLPGQNDYSHKFIAIFIFSLSHFKQLFYSMCIFSHDYLLKDILLASSVSLRSSVSISQVNQ